MIRFPYTSRYHRLLAAPALAKAARPATRLTDRMPRHVIGGCRR